MGPHSPSVKARGGVEETGRWRFWHLWEGEERQAQRGWRESSLPFPPFAPPSFPSSPLPTSCVNQLPLQAAFTSPLYGMETPADFPSILKTFPQGSPLSSCLHSLPKKSTFSPPPKTLSQKFSAFSHGQGPPFSSYVTRTNPLLHANKIRASCLCYWTSCLGCSCSEVLSAI